MSSRKYTKIEGPYIDSIPLTYRHKIPISKTERFWRGLESGKIFATRCKKCGKTYFPPQADCPDDFSSEMEWVELPQEGIVETYTKVYARPQGFEEFEPYTIAIVNVGNVKIMCWVEGQSEIHIGEKVSITTKKINGRYIIICMK